MAAHKNKRRRKRNKSRLAPLLKLLSILTLFLAATYGATVFFQVESVNVTGYERYTQEQVVAASGIELQDNLFRMNKHEIANKILSTLPYIETVVIQRSLPSTILIKVTEWDAVAQVSQPQDETQASTQTWLISVGGKLLERAPENSPLLRVSGIDALVPRAGELLAVPLEQQSRLDGLLALLAQLQQQEMLGQVSQIEVTTTKIILHYLDSFIVKIPLNTDFAYQLRVLEAAVEQTQAKLGEQTRGTFDLTREDYTAVYSPE